MFNPIGSRFASEPPYGREAGYEGETAVSNMRIGGPPAVPLIVAGVTVMHRIISAASAVLLAAAAWVYTAPASHGRHCDYELTSAALVLEGAPGQAFADTVNELYLAPSGYHGDATPFILPYSLNFDQNVSDSVKILVDEITNQYNAGDFDAADPLYVFGYSWPTVVMGMAEKELADYGVPQDYLHFVMVGDSWAENTGFMSTYIDLLPQGLRPLAMQVFEWLNMGSVVGYTTPDHLYPTDVYSLSGDGFANWDGGANIMGILTDHEAYLGLTPAEVASATLDVHGLTNYFTIDSANVDIWSALWNSLTVLVSSLF